MGWKSITGALGVAFGYLCSPEVLNVLPAKISGGVIAVCGVLSAFGFRHAIAKVPR